MPNKKRIEKLEAEIKRLRKELTNAKDSRFELTKRIFHLKTLYDVSREICELKLPDEIMKNFIMTITGTFGMLGNFVVVYNKDHERYERLIHWGLERDSLNLIKEDLKRKNLHEIIRDVSNVKIFDFNSTEIKNMICFPIDEKYFGLLGLGEKISGSDYTTDEKELLITLVNNLSIFIRNAHSFETIKRLNEDLQRKNVELEITLKELNASLKKIEILENIKFHLGKFVPSSIRKIIDESPEMPSLGKTKQDVSVLFLDLAGYTKMTENLKEEEISYLIEKYFSHFIDDIYENGGDINETAGDGLMIIFKEEDKIKNALQAVRTAVSIRKKANLINNELKGNFERIVVNMGINSGMALLGPTKFESYLGSRWTYTARGTTTNLAARIGECAKGGAILLSKTTAERVKDWFKVKFMGAKKFKNITKTIDVFKI